MKRLSVTIAGVAMLAMLTAMSAAAQRRDQATNVTFSGPVEVPGRVLTAGTYVFRLLDSPSDRNIVQIFNKDQTQLLATIMALPDYRLKPADKPVITFEERPTGSPEAVQAWFYPGTNYGHEFVYPKQRATELAKRVNKPVLSMPSELASNITKPVKAATEPPVVAMKKAPVKAIRPTGEEFEITEVILAKPAAAPASAPPVAAVSRRLPHTASSLPLIGLVWPLLPRWMGRTAAPEASALIVELDSGRFIYGAPRRPSRMRFAVGWAANLLLAAGVASLCWFAVTVLRARTSEGRANQYLEQVRTGFHGAAIRPTHLAQGAMIGRIEIPRAGIRSMFFEGSDDDTLRLGVGHIEGTAMPGDSGNVGLAGHRDTIFRGLKDIRPNDQILVTTLFGGVQVSRRLNQNRQSECSRRPE